jgi:phosphoglycolate phosphatase-like HAD superfamily hydrolase
MQFRRRALLGWTLCAFALGYGLDGARSLARADDPLPSWNDGANKRAILDFVRGVTDEAAPTFVRAADRIATFDNDGTLWVEHPLYSEAEFMLDRVRALAPEHPEWRREQPFQAVVEGNREALAKLTKHDVVALIAATHSGMTPEEFDAIAKQWFAGAKHPRFGRLYTECVYQPMLELLTYLRSNGFRTYIVSGGGVDFMRAVADELYGVPPGQVIGSSGKTEFEIRAGRPVLIKLPEISSVDDKQGKPINIQQHIGQRPILAFGNSDGDLQMLQYTGAGAAPHLMLLVHHDDGKREYAYDRATKVGKLDEALNAAAESGFRVVSMKNDWKVIFPPLAPQAASKQAGMGR